MIRSLSPQQAAARIAGGNVDVIDVREAAEYRAGHVPQARHVPLSSLLSNFDDARIAGPVLFVCERGGRSMQAAQAAELRGIEEILNLDGGTAAWRAAGLSIATSATKQPEPTAEADNATPELDAVVGENVRALRTARGWSLDILAGASGVGRQTLGQIENGQSTPNLGTLWKIARAFDVSFASLLARPRSGETRVFRHAQAKRIIGAAGRFSSRALFSPEDRSNVEFYELWLAAKGREDAEAHASGTREHLIVTAGALVLELGAERYELHAGDAIEFTADVRHAYVNPSNTECWMNLVMTYGAR